MKRLWGIVLSMVVAAPASLAQAPGQGQGQGSSTIIEVHTQPYKKFPVHFMRMGKISEVNVKLGDVVKKGDQLMKQDTSIEEAELAILKFDAENELPVKAAEYKLTL